MHGGVDTFCASSRGSRSSHRICTVDLLWVRVCVHFSRPRVRGTACMFCMRGARLLPCRLPVRKVLGPYGVLGEQDERVTDT
jgi:hypothetical protein